MKHTIAKFYDYMSWLENKAKKPKFSGKTKADKKMAREFLCGIEAASEPQVSQILNVLVRRGFVDTDKQPTPIGSSRSAPLTPGL